MKKRLSSLAAAFLLLLTAAGCGSTKPESPGQPADPPAGEILYSNLADRDAQDTVSDVLLSGGISQARLDTFFSWVEDCNQRLQGSAPAAAFVPMEGDCVDYSDLSLQLRELEDGTLASEPNCRLTAFLLLGDHLTASGTPDELDTYLMFDLDAIDTQAQFRMSPEERSLFTLLYNRIPVGPDDTLLQHQEAVEAAWKERGLALDGVSGLSLITVYLHDPMDQVRFAGHAGVLAETEQGLLFVEKFGPYAPFQATWFQDRSQLRSYLLARPDLYGDGTELEPIILENGAILA